MKKCDSAPNLQMFTPKKRLSDVVSIPLLRHAATAPSLTLRADMLVELRVRRYQEIPKAFGGFESGTRRARNITDDILTSKTATLGELGFHADDLEKDAKELESRATSTLYVCILISATSSLLWGYHTAVMSPAEATALPDHSVASWSTAVTAMVVGAIAGSLMGDRLAESHGRKQSVLITSVVNLVGALGMLVAGGSVLIAVCARLLVGIAAGLTMCIVPVYIGEIAPVQLRGSLNGVPQLMNCLGILLSQLLGLVGMGAFGLFAFAAGVAGLQLLAGLMFPLLPSPEYLVAHAGRDQAVAAAKRLYGYDDGEATQHVEVLDLAGNNDVDADVSSSGGLFSDRGFGIMTSSVVVLNITQQFSGFNAILQYSGTFFKPLFANPNLPAVMVGVANLVGSLGSMRLMQHTPRKVLLVISISGMLFAMVMVATCSGMLVVVAVVAFAVCFQLGLGPLPGCLSSEMFDSSRRSSAQGLGAAMNNLANCAITFTFPLVYGVMHSFTFVIFGTILSLALVFVIKIFSETLDKHPEQIHADSMASSKQFPKEIMAGSGLETEGLSADQDGDKQLTEHLENAELFSRHMLAA